MTEQIAIKQWGNSQGIIIPKKILDALNWKRSDSLELEVVDDKIQIKKRFVHRTFADRLKEYDGKISVCEFDWGEPQGGEML